MNNIINIGSRLECFFTGRLVDEEKTTAEYRMHNPVRRETVMVHDEPWEGSISCYHVIIKDGDIYRMYYRGGSGVTLRSFICYAESTDCLHWVKPELGLFDFNGSKDNNIIIDESLHPNIDNFFVFKDTNPACPPERLFKAVSLYNFPTENGPDPEGGLRVYYSADGIHFRKGELLLDADTGAYERHILGRGIRKIPLLFQRISSRSRGNAFVGFRKRDTGRQIHGIS